MAVVRHDWQNDSVVDGANPTYTRSLIVSEVANELAAISALAGSPLVPSISNGLTISSVSVVERISNDTWRCQASWAVLSRQDESETASGGRFSFEIGTEAAHITHGSSVTAYGVAAPDYEGAINVTENGVEGVDISVPTLRFTKTAVLLSSSVTNSYIATLMSLAGCTNNAPYGPFAAGEVLFEGCSGSLQQWNKYELTYRFAASPNVTGLSVGDITGIAKKGWEYLWVRYKDEHDGSANLITKKPRAVYVHTVRPSGNFAGIGV